MLSCSILVSDQGRMFHDGNSEWIRTKSRATLSTTQGTATDSTSSLNFVWNESMKSGTSSTTWAYY